MYRYKKLFNMTTTEEWLSDAWYSATPSLYDKFPSASISIRDAVEHYIDSAPVEGTELLKIAKGMMDTLIMKYRAEPATSKLRDEIYRSLDEYLNTLKEEGIIKDYGHLTVSLILCLQSNSIDVSVAVLLRSLKYKFISFSI